MRHAFTLIELMIVIAIIAIIASIAIPNLLESRITANESAAATSLKSGLFPAQVQFNSGGYVDVNTNGRGCFTGHTRYLAGGISTGTVIGSGPNKALQLMDNKFADTSGTTAGTGSNIAQSSRVGSYDYALFVSSTTESDAEQYWAGVAGPTSVDGTMGRKGFAITAGGTIYQTKNTISVAGVVPNLLGFGAATSMFSGNPTISGVANNSANAVPYSR